MIVCRPEVLMVVKRLSLLALTAVISLFLMPGTYASHQEKAPAGDGDNIEALIETSRGNIVIDNGRFVGRAGSGVFLKRATR